MKQLNDIVLQPGTAAKYSLSIKITDVDEPENEDKGEGFLINGDDIARILAWAEWKLTNTLCEFDDQEGNSMGDYAAI
jgi:hypothetical protein